MTRSRILLTVSSLGLAGLLGLAGCAAAPTAANLSDEVAALQSIGFDTGLAAEPTPAPSGSATDKERARLDRIASDLGKLLLSPMGEFLQ